MRPRGFASRRPASPATCFAEGCSERIARGMLMCRTHWFRVPRDLQDAIRAATRHSQAWRDLCQRARAHVANHNPAALAARITGERL